MLTAMRFEATCKPCSGKELFINSSRHVRDLLSASQRGCGHLSGLRIKRGAAAGSGAAGEP